MQNFAINLGGGRKEEADMETKLELKVRNGGRRETHTLLPDDINLSTLLSSQFELRVKLS